MENRTQYLGKNLSEFDFNVSGVISERFEKGNRIELQSEEQVLNDASDRGLNIVEADTWLSALKVQTPPTFSFPPHVNSTDFISVENQGMISSCLGVSGASVADWLYWIKTGEIKRFSGFYHYIAAQMQDNLQGRDMGSVPTSGWKVAQRIGFVPEEEIEKRLPKAIIQKWGGCYPTSYVEGYRYYKPLMNNPEIREIAAMYTVKSLVVMKKPQQIIDFIGSGQGGVQQCSPWKKAFDGRSDKITQYHGNNRQGQHGHHAYYISGYNTDKWCNITNSWGTQYWGDEGGKSISQSAHQECLNDRLTYCVGMSDFAPDLRVEPRITDFSDIRFI